MNIYKLMRKQKHPPHKEKPPFHCYTVKILLTKNEQTASGDVMQNLYLNKLPRNQKFSIYIHTYVVCVYEGIYTYAYMYMYTYI